MNPHAPLDRRRSGFVACSHINPIDPAEYPHESQTSVERRATCLPLMPLETKESLASRRTARSCRPAKTDGPGRSSLKTQ